MSPPIPSIFFPTIIIGTFLLVGALLLALWHRSRHPRTLSDPESLQREIEHSDTSQGDQVWFSRQVHRGRWRNWSLIIRNQRYELRPGRASSGEPPLVFERSACSLAYERQQASDDKALLPSYKGYFVCLIGWTRRSDQRIEESVEKVLAGLEAYGAGGDTRTAEEMNAIVQRFLKGVTDRVLETRKAADYAWFRENVTIAVRDVETKLMAGPQEKEGGLRPRSMQMMPMASVDAGVRAWARG